MKNIKWTLFVCFVAAGFLMGCQQTVSHQSSARDTKVAYADEMPMNDAELLNLFEKNASEYYKKHGNTSAIDYKKQMRQKQCNVETKEMETSRLTGAFIFKQQKMGVLMLGRMHKCGQCPDDHISVASAFVIKEDGICVTNYHVFQSYDPSAPIDYITYFVMDAKQNVYPVKEVLAASKQDDLSVFRIDTKGQSLDALALGQDVATGESIHLISHPDHRFFRYSQGVINRKYLKPGTTKVRQSISADFAKGSSGAPIMDDCGNVVGIVAGTQNIYYLPDENGYQMTIKEIIPVSRLKALIRNNE